MVNNDLSDKDIRSFCQIRTYV